MLPVVPWCEGCANAVLASWRKSVLCIVMCLAAQPAAAITIQINYTYDTTNFFGSGNPQGATAGAQARPALEAAASYYSVDSYRHLLPIKFRSTTTARQGRMDRLGVGRRISTILRRVLRSLVHKSVGRRRSVHRLCGCPRLDRIRGIGSAGPAAFVLESQSEWQSGSLRMATLTEIDATHSDL